MSSLSLSLQLAAGEIDLAVGGDQGGSIRIPAAWCGVVGLKPTYGLVPYTGAMAMLPCIDHLGPMAQNVFDCALLLEVINKSTDMFIFWAEMISYNFVEGHFRFDDTGRIICGLL